MLTKQEIHDILSSSEVKTYLQNHGIVHLSLFGSVADSEATEKSDVDLLYEQDETMSLGWEIIDIINYITQKVQAPVDFVEKNSLHERLKARILQRAEKIF